MPQAIWSGTIGFGLVTVPIRLYPATRKQDVRFHELDRVTGQRVHHQRVRPVPAEDWQPAAWRVETPAEPAAEPAAGRPAPAPLPRADEPLAPTVSYEDVVKGFEVAPDQYVALSRDELEAIAPDRSRTIEIEQFVDLAAIDPIYFQTNYYAVPERSQARSFALLLDVMRQTRKAAVGWVVLRRRRHLAVVRPHGDLLLLTTMLYADEILPTADVQPALPTDLSRKEKDMAALLVTTLAGPFEPERYGDEYRQRVKDLIAGKTPVAIAQPAAESSGVADLMAALRASVEAARARKTQRTPRAAPTRVAAKKQVTRRRKTA